MYRKFLLKMTKQFFEVVECLTNIQNVVSLNPASGNVFLCSHTFWTHLLSFGLSYIYTKFWQNCLFFPDNLNQYMLKLLKGQWLMCNPKPAKKFQE